MPSAKHERLYGEKQKEKKTPPAGGVPPWVEGGLVNDRSGKGTDRLRQQGFKLKKGVDY